MSACLTDSQLAAYLDGEASDEVSRHLDECPACRRLVAAVGRAADVAPDALTAPAAPVAPLSGGPLPRGTSVGRYVVMDLIGAGAMGAVYSAYDPELDRKVALKLLRDDAAQGESRLRLVREAQAMAKLSDPAVVPVHDAGVFEGRVFIAMDLVNGETLTAWLKRAPRPWRDIVAMFLKAARGLAAAHAGGVVHRDFKPDNVLVGRDGRVCVGDFGLARAETHVELDLPATASQPILHLTSTGTFIGTPAYMAPEQLRREPATAATDQFAFCVALHEGLYGARPFAGRTFAELAAAVRSGRVPPAPPASKVPAWVRRAVLRGLALQPEARFPSMLELIAALESDPRIVRRRAAAALAAVAVIAAGALALHRSATRQAQLCKGADAEMAEVWNPERKRLVRAAFIAAGQPDLAETAWTTFQRLVNGYAAEWTAQRTEACEATRVTGTQSEELLDLRMACLRDDHERLRALADVFSRPRRGLIDSAVKAATLLPPLARCRAESALRVRVPPPRPEQRDAVEALRAQLSRTAALFGAGDYEASLRGAQAVGAAARGLGYLPLEAEALELFARSEVSQRRLKEGAADYQDAANAGVAAGDARVTASALAALVWTVGVQLGDNAEGQRLLSRAAPLAERLGEQRITADLLYFGGILRFESGDVEGAEVSFERCRAARVALYGEHHPDVANIDNALGRVANNRGDYRTARGYYLRAIATIEVTSGREHPLLWSTVGNLADNEWEDLGNYAAALALAERSLALARRVGPDSPDVGAALTLLGTIRADLGEPEAGLEEVEAGLAIVVARRGKDHPQAIRAERELAAILSMLGRHDEAVAHARAGYAGQVQREGEGASDTVQAAVTLADTLRDAGRVNEAQAVAARALVAAEAAPRPSRAYIGRVRGALCRALVAARRPTAPAVCRQAEDELRVALGPVHPTTAWVLGALGRARLQQGDARGAIPDLVASHAILATRQGDRARTAEVRAALDAALGPTVSARTR